MPTKISWTQETWNPVTGCTPISPGCAHCYAASIAERFWGERKFGDVRFHMDRLSAPLRWRKPREVFVNSMSDLFHEDVADDSIAAVFGVMSAAPKHTFQVLTKRPERAREWYAKMDDAGGVGRYIRSDDGRNTLRGLFNAVQKTEVVDGRTYRSVCDPWMEVMNGAACNYGRAPLSNLWLGVTAENQEWADKRIPVLLQIPAAARFVSLEPLLGPVDLIGIRDPQRFPGCLQLDVLGGREIHEDDDCMATKGGQLDWIIVGAETGPGRRPCKTEWIESIVAQCRKAGVPCHVKALEINGKIEHDIEKFPPHLRVREYPRKAVRP